MKKEFAFTALSPHHPIRNQPGKQEMLNKYLLNKFINKLMASLCLFNTF